MADQVRYSMKEILKQDKGEVEKSAKTSKSTKTATKKAKSQDNGKYVTKIVDGIKYMVLK